MAPKKKQVQQKIGAMFAKKTAANTAAAAEIKIASPPPASASSPAIATAPGSAVASGANPSLQPAPLPMEPRDLPVIWEKLWIGLKTAYDEYEKASPLVGDTEVAEGSGARTSARNKKPRQFDAGGTTSVGHLNLTDDEAEDDGVDDDEAGRKEQRGSTSVVFFRRLSVERKALEMVEHLEQFVTQNRALDWIQQEMLVHMVLNADNHSRTGPGALLSPRAHNLLMLNARLHPPCKIISEGGVNVLITNKQLWMPSKERASFDNIKKPLPLSELPLCPHKVFIKLVHHAHQQAELLSQQACRAASPAAATSSRTQRGSAIIPDKCDWDGSILGGAALLLTYLMHVLQVDTEMRLKAVGAALQDPQDILRGGVMGKLLSSGAGTWRELWQFEDHSCKAMIKDLAAIVLLAAAPEVVMTSAEETVAKAAAAPKGESPMCKTPKNSEAAGPRSTRSSPAPSSNKAAAGGRSTRSSPAPAVEEKKAAREMRATRSSPAPAVEEKTAARGMRTTRSSPAPATGEKSAGGKRAARSSPTAEEKLPKASTSHRRPKVPGLVCQNPLVGLGELGSLARHLLSLLYEFYMATEKLQDFSLKTSYKTDPTFLSAMSDYLLHLMVGTRGLEASGSESVVSKLKDPEQKVILLSCLSPRAQLHLLTLAAASNIVTKRVDPELQGVLKLAAQYLLEKGNEGTAAFKVDPVDLLEHLNTDAMYDSASLFIGVASGQGGRAGFGIWLGMFVAAAVAASASEGTPCCDLKLLDAAFLKLHSRWANEYPGAESVGTTVCLATAKQMLLRG